jgi:hypothetical protein
MRVLSEGAFALLLGGICCGALLSAGPAAAIDVCGDGICNGNAVPPETLQTCPADCGGPPGGCLRDTCDNGSCSRPAAGDADGDSVPDRLEYDLAHKFFPSALMQWAGVDRDESYLHANRATPYTLKRYTSNSTLCDAFAECLEIRWAIAFSFDHGDILDIGSHQGDSEMYAALLRRTTSWSEAQADPADWVMIRDFTAAHWGGGRGESSKVGIYGFCPESCGTWINDAQTCNAHSHCQAGGSCTGVHGGCYNASQSSCQSQGGCTWNPSCSRRFAWSCYQDSPQTSRAKLYCSESKHALYHTDGECDSGGWLNSDDCPNNRYNLRSWKSGLLQNAGNSNSHAAFDTTMQNPSYCGLYNIWGGASFGEATSYKHNFTATLRWALEYP